MLFVPAQFLSSEASVRSPHIAAYFVVRAWVFAFIKAKPGAHPPSPTTHYHNDAIPSTTKVDASLISRCLDVQGGDHCGSVKAPNGPDGPDP